MSSGRDTATLDALYLEWSQFTAARNQREIDAVTRLRHLLRDMNNDPPDLDEVEARIRGIIGALS